VQVPDPDLELHSASVKTAVPHDSGQHLCMSLSYELHHCVDELQLYEVLQPEDTCKHESLSCGTQTEAGARHVPVGHESMQ